MLISLDYYGISAWRPMNLLVFSHAFVLRKVTHTHAHIQQGNSKVANWVKSVPGGWRSSNELAWNLTNVPHLHIWTVKWQSWREVELHFVIAWLPRRFRSVWITPVISSAPGTRGKKRRNDRESQKNLINASQRCPELEEGLQGESILYVFQTSCIKKNSYSHIFIHLKQFNGKQKIMRAGKVQNKQFLYSFHLNLKSAFWAVWPFWQPKNSW